MGESRKMNKHKMSSLLVLIPAFNEEKNIKHVITDLLKHCPKIDYIVINDGSTDHTREICLENGYPMLDLPINLGLAGAFQAGMKYAVKNGYQYAIQFDADGQHCAEFIPGMLICAQKEQKNIVIASRFVKGKKGWSFREIGSRMIGICIFLTTGKRIKDPTSGMRLYDSSVMNTLAMHINYSPEPDTLAALLKSGCSVKETPAVMNERISGESYLNFTNAFKYMFHVCVSILIVNRFR